MTQLITQNAKIKKTNAKQGINLFNFGIPAYKSSTGLITCPSAKDCIKPCYARQGFYNMPTVKNAYEFRLNSLESNNFLDDLAYEIYTKSPTHIRINDSGDIYNAKVLGKWIKLANAFPDIIFYAYTKQVALFKKHSKLIPSNLVYRFSFGGKEDHLIDIKTDRHAMVFKDAESIPSNYVDASHDDSFAFNKDIKNIGLAYHGFNSKLKELKQWTIGRTRKEETTSAMT